MEDIQTFWWPRTGWWEQDKLLAVPSELPATQFGIGVALAGLKLEAIDGGGIQVPSLNQQDICGLLPAGPQALEVCSDLRAEGYCTYKWKVGVFPIDQELTWLDALLEKLPKNGRLRLDANGGLTVDDAEHWLDRCDRVKDQVNPCPIEYLEQPLPPDQFGAMQQLAERFETSIALDESMSTLGQMEAWDYQTWPGFYVIKPAIAGFPFKLQALLQKLGKKVIFSSAFETAVGRQAVLDLALSHYRQCYPEQTFPALGFGICRYFEDDWDHLTPKQLWERI
jgi:O-succinylbenzoate synthase